jgi:DNA-binding FadR family transcriptional regulator
MTCSTCAAPSNPWPCAGPASGRRTGEQVEAILLACNALERAVDSGIGYNRADQLFHECILAASHNQFIEQMVPALGALLAVCFEVSAADPDELRRTLPIL